MYVHQFSVILPLSFAKLLADSRFPSVVNLITQVIGVFAFIEVVRKRREAIPSRVAFSGKPEIVMAIVRDPANPSGVVLRSS